MDVLASFMGETYSASVHVLLLLYLDPPVVSIRGALVKYIYLHG